ncbi:MAG: uracil-DNA glycosylase [Bacteroidales bacterium]|nr:uracil-DNA glycosylase [Bacteroidales bacterium]
MDVKIESSWKEVLQPEFEKEDFKQLTEFVRKEYTTKKIFPPGSLIFNAFDLCPYNKVKVVIIGQDPYHGPGQANGLCFSVNDGVDFPPSLVNIYKEIENEYAKQMPKNGDLSSWAKQGVLLLNAILTVQAHMPCSHQGKGWETFTDAVIRILAEKKEHLVFLLWGSYAQQKGLYIDTNKHLVLKSPHPSPLSAYRGFIGNRHFQLANQYLKEHGMSEIEW